MHKLHKAAVLLAALGSVGILAAGTAHADGTGQPGGQVSVQQSTTCRSHDLNIDILGAVGLLDGVLGNGLNGEGDPAVALFRAEMRVRLSGVETPTGGAMSNVEFQEGKQMLVHALARIPSEPTIERGAAEIRLRTRRASRAAEATRWLLGRTDDTGRRRRRPGARSTPQLRLRESGNAVVA